MRVDIYHICSSICKKRRPHNIKIFSSESPLRRNPHNSLNSLISGLDKNFSSGYGIVERIYREIMGEFISLKSSNLVASESSVFTNVINCDLYYRASDALGLSSNVVSEG